MVSTSDTIAPAPSSGSLRTHTEGVEPKQQSEWAEARTSSRASFMHSVGEQIKATQAAADERVSQTKDRVEHRAKALRSIVEPWWQQKLESVPARHREKVNKYGWQCYNAPPSRALDKDQAAQVAKLRDAPSLDAFRSAIQAWEDQSMIPETTKEVIVRHCKEQPAWENDKKWKHWEEVKHEKVPASWIPHPLDLIDESIRQRGAGDTYFGLIHSDKHAWKDISARGARRSEQSVLDLWVMSKIVQSAVPPKTFSLGEKLSAQLWSSPNEWRCNLYDEEHFATRWNGALNSGIKSQIDLNSEMRRTVEAKAPERLFELDDFIGSRNCAPTPREAFWAVAHALHNRDVETGQLRR